MQHYLDIPVCVRGQDQLFDFEFRQHAPWGFSCVVTSKGYTLVFDGELAILRCDMPWDWIEPAACRLEYFLKSLSEPC
ncbi:MAG: hypothetical protein EOP49_26995 [Sphingobacteriales bacterium]|nr:MAG: hypothetical protein EOP49_26995 [Sphingobacteriales bacterium]